MNFVFFLNSALLGVGLAMDAFSVSVVNAMQEPKMSQGKRCSIAGTFAFFQFAMPMIGWFCVRQIAAAFKQFQPFIPWIALALLLFIGGKMLIEGIRGHEEEAGNAGVGFLALMVQGVATSIDALSVGFTIASYGLGMAIVCCLIIAVVTFIISYGGILIGKRFGTLLSSKAAVLGGIILIGIGLEIFITGI